MFTPLLVCCVGPGSRAPFWNARQIYIEGIGMPRGRGPSNYRGRDLDLALKTVQRRGLTIARVEIGADGRIIIVVGEPVPEHTPGVVDDWEDAR